MHRGSVPGFLLPGVGGVDADERSLAYYGTLAGEIREKIDSVLDKDEYGNTVFHLTSNKRCPFLNDGNLCDKVLSTNHCQLTLTLAIRN